MPTPAKDRPMEPWKADLLKAAQDAGLEVEPEEPPKKMGQLKRYKLRGIKRHKAGKKSRGQMNRIYERDHGVCHICGEFVPRDQASRDHIVSLLDGGTNDDENLLLAHQDCNTRRGRGGTKRADRPD